MLDVFTEMEKKGILGEDNLTVLKTLCEKIDKSLLKKIEEYELNQFGKLNQNKTRPLSHKFYSWSDT